MDKYTITNPNLLVEEIDEKYLRMLVNVKGKLKELINTKTIEDLIECCESPEPPTPTQNDINIVNLGFGDWWHYQLKFGNQNYDVDVKVLGLLTPQFGEVVLTDQFPFETQNLSLNYVDNQVVFEFDAIIDNETLHYTYKTSDKFVSGTFTCDGESGELPETIEYKLNGVDLTVDGEIDSEKLNIAKINYHENNIDITEYGFINESNGSYASMFDVSGQFVVYCMWNYSEQPTMFLSIVYSSLMQIQQLQQNINNLVAVLNESLNARLKWKGVEDNINDVDYNVEFNSIYGIKNSFISEDSYHLGQRQYPAGSFVIVTQEIETIPATNAMLSVTFKDISNGTSIYTVGISLEDGVTTLNHEDIDYQITGEWQFSSSIDGQKSENHVATSYDSINNRILLTVFVNFSHNVPEYSGANIVSYTISIPDNFNLTGTITASDIYVDYVYKNTVQYSQESVTYIPSQEERTQNCRYIIPGLK